MVDVITTEQDKDLSGGLVAPDGRRLLILDNRGEIYKLLKQRFSSQVFLERQSNFDGLCGAVGKGKYQMLICHIDGSAPGARQLQSVFDLLSKHSPDTYTIIVADQEPEPAFSASQRSFYQYVPSPIDPERFADLVRVALNGRATRKAALSGPEPAEVTAFEGMLGISLPMRQVFQQIIDAAAADIPVLVTGETGTGKDLVAAAIHNRSKRANKPYVPVNTGAIAPELIASELFGHEKGAYTGAIERRQGLFEQADGGTIFLDEISTMDERTQVGLLRILESKTFRRVRGDKDIHVDVRVVAATNESLDQAIQQKRFREDLYYRLDVFHIHVPALRERPGGVTLLTNHYVIKFNETYGKAVKTIAPEALRALRRYHWPGNVRELKHVIQRAVLMSRGEELTADLLPERITKTAPSSVATAQQEHTVEPRFEWAMQPGMTLEAVEKQYIAMTLADVKGNKKQAALQLGISRRALYNKLQKYSLC
jgi:DNA-binding NtrC family response regulator